MGSTLFFTKMNGLGNDFIIVDGRSDKIAVTTEQIIALCARAPANGAINDRTPRPNETNGAIKQANGAIQNSGCDQLLILEPSKAADIFLRIYNADGSEVSACGNGTRCAARLVMDERAKDSCTIETRVGLLRAKRVGEMISVDMGVPKLKWDEIPLSEEFQDTRGIELEVGPLGSPLIHTPSVVNMGNPHAVFFVDDLNVLDLSRSGPMLETHPLFPEGANISLARVDARDALSLKVWERGAGLTKACGTAACAAAVSAIRKRLCDRTVNVRLPGGVLVIEWREADEHVIMTGPATYDGTGTVEL